MTPSALHSPAIDPLTGLQGFEAFKADVSKLLKPATLTKHPFCLGLFDLDAFGKINEERGREAGDALLRMLAARLVGMLAPSCKVYRYGGDAFGVVLPDAEKEQALLHLEKVRADLGAALSAETGAQVELSCGVAAAPDDATELQDLLRKLTAALYRAKAPGPSKTCLAREERMIAKTSHFTQGQLAGLARLSRRLGKNEASLLREAADDLLKKYNG